MTKKLLATLAVTLTLLLPLSSLRAELGVIDNIPGATLLLPYFEVDLGNPSGINTVFSVSNGNFDSTNSPTAILTHITLWSNLGIPTLSFSMYLTGLDTQVVSLRDVFNGTLPRTASAGQDPGDTFSPKGPLSQDINFASCGGILPYAPLSATQVTDLRNAHTGQATGLASGQCMGAALGDNIARGYVTIDTVNSCYTNHPDASGYFGNGGGGIATNQNNLWGDFYLIDPGQNFAQGETLVALEANAASISGGTYSFYARLVGGNSADNREPLATQWAADYEVGPGAVPRSTDLLVWRDPGRKVAPFNCADALPAPFPLSQNEIIALDTEENPATITPVAGSEPFPFAANRTRLGNTGHLALPVPHRSGWLRLNLGSTPLGRTQAYVMVLKSSRGRFSTGHTATQLDNLLH